MSSRFTLGVDCNFSSSLNSQFLGLNPSAPTFNSNPPSQSTYHLIDPSLVSSMAQHSFKDLHSSTQAREISFKMPEVAPLDYVGIVTDVVKLGLNSTSLGSIKTLEMFSKGSTFSVKLAEEVKKSQDSGDTRNEALVCQTLRLGVQEISGDIIKGAITAGIPVYAAAAMTNPWVALTVPGVLSELPNAFRGADMTAQVTGNSAEYLCHHGFDAARKLSKRSHDGY